MTTNSDHAPGLVRPDLHLGDIRIRFIEGGRMSLDGGSMFGIIPKPLWTRVATPDELNRVPLSTTCLLVETAGRRLLVETGVGNKYDEKERGIYALGHHWLLDSLAALDIDPASIDIVILTHLHFDHAGGISVRDPSGALRLTFPRADIVASRGEWDDARGAHYVMTGTYRAENLEPIEQSGRLRLVDGEADIAPGVSVFPLPGHTRHQQGVRVAAGGRTLLHLADLLPTAAHVGLRYNMAYDLMPFENMIRKGRILDAAVREQPILVTGQDPHWPTWRAVSGPRGVGLERDSSPS